MCIEGYPRSGNTYATLAISDIVLNHANVDPEWKHAAVLKRLIHHTHDEAVLVESVREGIPTLSLIRTPLDAIQSTYIYYAGKTPVMELIARWKRFYRSCLDLMGRDNFMIMRFDDIKDSTLPIAQYLTKLRILESLPASTVSPEDVLNYIREDDKRLGAVYRDRTAAPIDRDPTYITAFQNELKGISRNHLKALQSTYSTLNGASQTIRRKNGKKNSGD
ncbi:MAG: hypothetical protein U5R49_08235 [Deltaproteobacteria bacterium]|nr:hypothetical protein [Deltaproteobacteria bacterium]